MYLLLTVDLSNAAGENRQVFYDELDERGLHKVQGVTTTWRCSYSDDMNYSQIERDVKAEVAKAASEAGISNFKAIFQVGSRKPCSF